MYNNRNGPAKIDPSGGTVTRTLGGMGKLGTGTHSLEVLAVTEYPQHWVVILANPAGHAHSEAVTWAPPWVRVGIAVRARIGLTPGFVCVRDGEQYQLRDETGAPLTAWSDAIGELYQAGLARGLAPASTQLTEVTAGDNHWPVSVFAPGKPDPAPTPATPAPPHPPKL